MLELVQCEKCGNSNIPFDESCVNVVLQKSKYCDTCRESKTEKVSKFFCSVDCFNEFYSSNKLEEII